ncbi:MAG: Ig-like domain-containing protein [Bacteroidota bacterium]
MSVAPTVTRHTITTGAAVDPYGFFPVVAPGGTHSLKLGNNFTGSLAEKVRYYIHVPTTSNFILIYKFAVVLQNPADHTPDEQPRFEVNLYDSTTGASLPCGYISYVSSSSLPGFHLSTMSGSTPIYYRAWDSATVNLSDYAGQTIIIDFSTGDCSLGAHFGYAYVDVNCGSFTNYYTPCDTTTALTFYAPPGYDTYHWYDSTTFSTVYGTSATVTVPNPIVATTYAVILTPYAGLGCIDTSYVRVLPSALSLYPSNDTSLCPGDTATLTCGATDVTSPHTYSWLPSSGLSCTTCETVTATPGVTTAYTVTVTSPNGCSKDTTITVIIPGSPAAIAGPSALCVGTTATLTNATSGGVWSSSNSVVAPVSAAGIVTGLSAGTATISYTLSGPCGPVSATTVVTVDTVVAIGSITGPGIVCQGSSITLSSTSTGGVWSSSSPGVAIVSAGVVTGITAGTATITYTITNTCGIYTTTTVVTVVPLPSGAVLSGPANVCVGSSVTLTSSVPGGTWSSSAPARATVSTTGMVTGVSVGTAAISYAVANTCGSAVATVIVTVNLPPTAGVISVPSTFCVASPLFAYSSVPGGVWSSSTPSVTIGPSGLVTGVSAGTATISYAVTNICGTAVATKPVTVEAMPAPGTIAGPLTLCTGTTATLTVSSSGGTWTSTNPTVANISAAGVVSPLAAGTTTISYTVTNSCGTVAATAIITVIWSPVAGVITGPSTVCATTTIALSSSISGGIWSTLSGTASVSSTGVVTGLMAGVALISYSVTNPCGTAVATKSVTVNPQPVAGTVTGPGIVCEGSSIALSASSSGGIWSSGMPSVAVVSSTGVVTGISAGTALISYTVTNVCGTAFDTAVVTVNPLPVAGLITGPSVICSGDTVTLFSSVTGGVWSSSGTATVSTAGLVTGLSLGTATISYSVTNSCGTAVATKPLTVSVLPAPGIISGGPTVCTTMDILMTETVPGGVWSCTTNASITASGVLTGLTAGTATVTYSVTNICGTTMATKVITVNPTPDPGMLSGPPRVCAGSAITLTSSVPGGTWSSSNTAAATVTSTGIVTGIAAGVTTISYTLSNAWCTAHVTQIVTVDPLAVPGAIIADTFICDGETITISATVGGGTWSSSGTAATISVTGVVTAVSAGAIMVTYTVTNICGPAITTKLISINPLPDSGHIAGPHSLCVGKSITLTSDVTASWGTWSSSNTGVATINDEGIVTGAAAGVATITYTVTSSAGCSSRASHVVTVSPLPPAGAISGPPQICVTSAVTLTQTITGGTWTSSDATVATINNMTGEVHILRAGTTTISYFTAPNSYGCVNSTTYPLTILGSAPFTINETVTNPRCYGTGDGQISVSITGTTGPWQYLWNTGSTLTTIQNLARGTYNVEVTEPATGCRSVETYNVKEPDSLEVSPTVKNELCKMANGSILLTVHGGTSPYFYKWYDNTTADRLEGLPKGEYTVLVADFHQCEKRLAVDVLEGECEEIDVHNGVTPNGDGTNDYWTIDGIENYPNNLVQLFDKWGDKIFEQRGYNNRWNGKGMNGTEIPDGTYFYLIKLNATNGTGGKNVLTGSMLIKR